MKRYPNNYKKSQFLEFLKKNNVSDNVIKKFEKLPETLEHNGSEYKLNIVSTWYDGGTVNYNFEMNYYSIKLIEFLFSYVIYPDVERSIDELSREYTNLMKELVV